MTGSWPKPTLVRALEGLAHSTDGNSDDAVMNGTYTAKQIITKLVFAESKSVRTSTIILAAFNALAALATAASILYDCYWAASRWNIKLKAS